jgi:hypothetical protein
MIGRFFVFVLALLAASVPVAAQSIGGRYQVQGTNIDGSPYGGEAEITLTSDTTCRIRWVTGPTESTGICMRNGMAFSAGYVLGDKVGLVIYQVMQDGSLNGLWTVANQPGNGTEVLVPIK